MVKIVEFKKSAHLKLTKNFNSVGYRVGIMCHVEEGEDPMEAYKRASTFLKDIEVVELVKVKKRLDELANQKESPEPIEEEKLITNTSYIRSPIINDGTADDKIYEVYKDPCTYCGKPITFKKTFEGKFPVHIKADGTINGDGHCPNFS